jgi:hypothetical protein
VRHLNPVGADAAGAAVDQQRLAGAQVSRHLQVRPHRACGFGQRGGLVHLDGGGNRHYLTGRRCGVFGVAAAGQQSADFLPGRPFGNTAADVGDHPSHFHAKNFAGARRRWIVAGGLQQIGTVDSGCADLDQHLTVVGHHIRNLGPHQMVTTWRFCPAGNRVVS